MPLTLMPKKRGAEAAEASPSTPEILTSKPSMFPSSNVKTIAGFGIPEDQIRVPTATERAHNPPEGFMAWSKPHCDSGVIPPLAPFYVNFISHLKIAPFQLNPIAWNIVVSLRVLFEIEFGREPTPTEILFLYRRKTARVNSYYFLESQCGFKPVEALKSNTGEFQTKYFFVPADPHLPREFRSAPQYVKPAETEALKEMQNHLRKLTAEQRSAVALLTDSHLRRCGLIKEGQSIVVRRAPQSKDTGANVSTATASTPSASKKITPAITLNERESSGRVVLALTRTAGKSTEKEEELESDESSEESGEDDTLREDTTTNSSETKDEDGESSDATGSGYTGKETDSESPDSHEIVHRSSKVNSPHQDTVVGSQEHIKDVDIDISIDNNIPNSPTHVEGNTETSTELTIDITKTPLVKAPASAPPLSDTPNVPDTTIASSELTSSMIVVDPPNTSSKTDGADPAMSKGERSDWFKHIRNAREKDEDRIRAESKHDSYDSRQESNKRGASPPTESNKKPRRDHRHQDTSKSFSCMPKMSSGSSIPRTSGSSQHQTTSISAGKASPSLFGPPRLPPPSDPDAIEATAMARFFDISEHEESPCIAEGRRAFERISQELMDARKTIRLSLNREPTLQQDLDVSQQIIKKSRQDLKDKDRDIKSLKADLRKKSETIKSICSKNTDLENQLEVQKKEVLKAQTELSYLENSIIQIKAEKEQLVVDSTRATQDRDYSIRERDQSIKERDQAVKEQDRVTAERDQLRDRLTEAEKELSATRDKLTIASNTLADQQRDLDESESLVEDMIYWFWRDKNLDWVGEKLPAMLERFETRLAQEELVKRGAASGSSSGNAPETSELPSSQNLELSFAQSPSSSGPEFARFTPHRVPITSDYLLQKINRAHRLFQHR